MKTSIDVADGTKMTDEQLGGLTRRSDELKRRINKGTLDYDWVMSELQRVVEGRTDQFVPPPGGRVHFLTVPVTLDRPWQDAVRAAGPNTPDEYKVWKVADLYLSVGIGTVQTKIILVNFGLKGGSLAEAVTWAKRYNLKQTHPLQVFAIGEHKPQLRRAFEFEVEPMFVIATQECFFEGCKQVCDVWWSGAKRESRMHGSAYVVSQHAWFAFARE